jgi:hypothetical protein
MASRYPEYVAVESVSPGDPFKEDPMSFNRIITLAAVAAAAFPTVATAAERPPATTGTEQSIIAILIGFTPPIGTNHGSVVPRP